jgi:ParB family transcriptional regulator, chromosome partitioning protein
MTMKLDHIALDRLTVDPTNMRHGRKAPDVADILPSIRARGVLQTLLVRPLDSDGRYGIVAGRRRYHASLLLAEERRAAGESDPEPLPCAILDAGDDAAAIEASLIENVARLDPDEVRQWEAFTRLVKEGRSVDEIAIRFGLPELTVRRVLALGNLLPRLRALYAKGDIDRVTVRHLTLASKAQQKDWLALHDDPQARAPTGSQVKAWLFGGAAIAEKVALFDVESSGLALVSDLFGEARWFADSDAFWTAQTAAIEAKRADGLAAGWSDVVIVGPGELFHGWEYEKTAKRKGGKVFIEVRASGEVTVHEGYLGRKEAQRAARGDPDTSVAKPTRPELTSSAASYVDLHRHAAVRAVLCDHPRVALRLVVAHIVAGSPLWRVEPEPQATRNAGIAASVAASPAEALFATHRSAALALLGQDEDGTIVPRYANGDRLVATFLRLLALVDEDVLAILSAAMGASLAAGHPIVAALGEVLGVDMADHWDADPAFFELIRDRAVALDLVREIAGDRIADANAKESGKVLKTIAAAHLAGADGRAKVERWVPRWMRFPASAYRDGGSGGGGVATVAAHRAVAAARAELGLADRDAGAGSPVPSTPDDGATIVAPSAPDAAMEPIADAA